MSTAIVVAVQQAARAKSRLSADITDDLREALVLAMLDDVLAAARAGHAGLLVVVSADPAYDAVARAHDAEVLRDAGEGYRAAAAFAVAHLADRVEAVLILPGDLPQVRPADIASALAAIEANGVLLVPLEDGGTAALGLRPLDAIAPAFGPDSAALHRAAAQAAGLRLVEARYDSMRVDVDTRADLDAVRAGAGPATRAVLARLGER
ncbi:MAG: 2-phospho-L-lactate guanylyltransferase [Dehalococcoidia bacterium]|nr:2-phospho-L-lactate guanylyltransferase [Dehalococcoidia bacterium]